MSSRLVPASSTVYTPDRLARAMVASVGDDSSGIWLDPCVGDGAFIAAIAELGVPKPRILAFDLALRGADRDVVARTRRGIDFVAWASSRRAVCDRVVMNPPFVGLNRLRGLAKRAALAMTMPDGSAIPLTANYWCTFVVAAMRLLKPGGCMTAVLPAAWEYARYARLIRDTIVGGFGELTVIRSASPLFPNVQEGAVILVARDRGREPCIERRVEVRDSAETIRVLEQLGRGAGFGTPKAVHTQTSKPGQSTRLGDLLDIHIGAVTGDASYFLLSEPERRDLELPRSALRPVLSRCRQLQGAFVTRRDWQRLLEDGERVWLFSPSASDALHPAVRRYLREGRLGLCRVAGYKIRSRNPWYRTPVPKNLHGFISGMSRRLPFLVLNRMPLLSASNTLYVVRFKPAVTRRDQIGIAVGLMSSAVRRQLASRARVYPDGLRKFEPSDLASTEVIVPSDSLGASLILQKATGLLLSGDEEQAEAVSDAWLSAKRRGTLVQGTFARRDTERDVSTEVHDTGDSGHAVVEDSALAVAPQRALG